MGDEDPSMKVRDYERYVALQIFPTIVYGLLFALFPALYIMDNAYGIDLCRCPYKPGQACTENDVLRMQQSVHSAREDAQQRQTIACMKHCHCCRKQCCYGSCFSCCKNNHGNYCCRVCCCKGLLVCCRDCRCKNCCDDGFSSDDIDIHTLNKGQQGCCLKRALYCWKDICFDRWIFLTML